MFDQIPIMESAALPPPLPSFRHSKLGALVAVGVIAACAIFVVVNQAEHRVENTPATSPNRMLELVARYAVGVKSLMQKTGQWNAELTRAMMRDTKSLARTDADALRVLILKGWMDDAWPAEADLAAMAKKNDSLKRDVEVITQLKATSGKVDEAEWSRLLKRHGWMATLARAEAGTKDDPSRAAVAQQAMGTAMVMIGAMSLGMVAAVGGVVLMILAISRWRSGKLRLTLETRSRESGCVLIEGFAIYLALFLFLPRVLDALSLKPSGWASYGPALGALIVGMTWPLMRGMNRASWRESLGLHGGAGFFREAGAGVLGWLAALPLIVLGMIAATWIVKLTGDFPSHPIVDVFAGNRWAKIGAIVLAVIWAPISEEVMFRGLLFPGLAAWVRWLLGVLLSAFVFAVIHPQGWAGVPAIMALAAAFSLLRMWRQSLIAPMMAHALNNGIMCTMMLLMW